MTVLSRDFIYTLPRNLLRSFRGLNLLWHILAIVATLIIVRSGLDWLYFERTRPFARYLFPAVILGWRMPVVFPVVSYLTGVVRKDRRAICAAYATAQAVVIGLIVAASYKAVTGRPGPKHSSGMLIDTSREFHFGILRGGIFYGWPSSHTTVAFGMAAAVWALYPDSKATRLIALLYALYIGIGVSMTIHWFSDFFAGAVIGAVIGTTVGRAFRERLHRLIS